MFLFRALLALSPIAILFVAQLLIDELTLGLAGEAVPYRRTMSLIGTEFGLLLLTETLRGGVHLLQIRISDLYRIEASDAYFETAALRSLRRVEQPSTQDRLARGRRHMANGGALVTAIGGAFESIATLLSLTVGMALISPHLAFLGALVLIPTLLLRKRETRSDHSFMVRWNPRRRELTYLVGSVTDPDDAKETILCNTASFLIPRFKKLAVEVDRAWMKHLVGWKIVALSVRGITLGAQGGVMAWLAFQVIAGHLSLGQLTFLAGSFRRLSGSGAMAATAIFAAYRETLVLRDYHLALAPLRRRQKSLSRARHDSTRRPTRRSTKATRTIESLELASVSYRYGEQRDWVLHKVNLSVAIGETTLVIGPSGAGKTTLAKILTGLYPPSAGLVRINGSIGRLRACRAHISAYWQEPSRYELSVWDNLAICRPLSPPSHDAVRSALAQTGMAGRFTGLDHLDRRLGRQFPDSIELSGGEWVRVGLSRALLRRADLYVFDEPTAHLDMDSKRLVVEAIRNLRATAATVIITHDPSLFPFAERTIYCEGLSQHNARYELSSATVEKTG